MRWYLKTILVSVKKAENGAIVTVSVSCREGSGELPLDLLVDLEGHLNNEEWKPRQTALTKHGIRRQGELGVLAVEVAGN